MVFVQQNTIKELRQDNEALKQQAAQVAPLQEQVARTAQEAANAGGGAAAREEQVHELARLRNEVSQLRRQTNDLAKTRQEVQTLQQRVASETEARKGQAASFQAESQRRQAMSACINNLRLLDSAKQQWALEQRKQVTDTPTMDDLRPYVGRGANGAVPVCPDGGVYTLRTIREPPTCSIPGHVLP